MYLAYVLKHMIVYKDIFHVNAPAKMSSIVSAYYIYHRQSKRGSSLLFTYASYKCIITIEETG